MTGDQVDEPGAVVIPVPARPDPLRPILPNPFGELPLTRSQAEATRMHDLFAEAFARLGEFLRDAFGRLAEACIRGFRTLARWFRIPRAGWRSPARTRRRMAGPITRAERIDRRTRRAQLRRTTKRRRAA